jgi:uncharacterized protein (DUF2336 family)
LNRSFGHTGKAEIRLTPRMQWPDTSVVEEFEQAFISGTPGKRAEMLQRVTNLFLTAPATLTNEQASLFDDIIEKLVTHLEHYALAALSVRLARDTKTPTRLIQRLASHDAIEVAGPLLAESGALNDQNLVAIAESKGQLHLSKIAERTKLSPVVTNVIVERGDRHVIRKVAGNSGANFSKFGMSILVMRSEGDDELIKTIAARRDIPPVIFAQLINYATEKAREHLIASARPEMRIALGQATYPASERMTSLVAFADDRTRAKRLVNSFKQDTELTNAKVIEFADPRRTWTGRC